MSHSVALLGVPTSAGAHFGGLEQGPQHFRRAGLLSRLVADGFDVRDLGDLPVAMWQSDQTRREPRNLRPVTEVAQRVAQRIVSTQAHTRQTLVVGGDCSITAGVVSGLSQLSRRLGIVYFDGHVDLNTLQTSDYGVLDSMVMSHLLGIVDNEFSRLGPTYPLLQDDQVLFVGYDPAGINLGEVPLLASRQTRNVSFIDLTARPEMVSTALHALEEHVDTIVVHFDVDVFNFIDFPVGNFPWYHGLYIEQVSYCLEQFLSSPKFGCMVLTEFNLDRDKYGRYAEHLIDILADKLLMGSAHWNSDDSAGDPAITHDS